MAKYTFSQGKVRVERGLYRPSFKKPTGMPQAGVVFLVVRPGRTDESETVTRVKENNPPVDQND